MAGYAAEATVTMRRAQCEGHGHDTMVSCVAASRTKRDSMQTKGGAEDGENDALNVLEVSKDVIIETSGLGLTFFRSRIQIKTKMMMMMHDWLRLDGTYSAMNLIALPLRGGRRQGGTLDPKLNSIFYITKLMTSRCYDHDAIHITPPVPSLKVFV